jgi:hypothetical protein
LKDPTTGGKDAEKSLSNSSTWSSAATYYTGQTKTSDESHNQAVKLSQQGKTKIDALYSPKN